MHKTVISKTTLQQHSSQFSAPQWQSFNIKSFSHSHHTPSHKNNVMVLNKHNFIKTLLPLLLYDIFSQYAIKKQRFEHIRYLTQKAKSRRVKKHILWSTINEQISEIQFRRMFCMSRDCFNELCKKIIDNVGESAFKSESYIDSHLWGNDIMFMANGKTTSRYISGEVKLAITLRLLAGGSCYDLGVIFDISCDYCNAIMFHVLQKWIMDTDIGEINMEKYLDDNLEMSRVSLGFSERSYGVLKVPQVHLMVG